MKIKKTAGIISLCAIAACNSAPGTEYELIDSQGMMKAVAVPEERVLDREHYMSVVEEECAQGGFCTILFFTGIDSVEFPLSDEALAAQVAQYSRNPKSGLDRLLLACRVSNELAADECF